ncbi:21095_t:CDS:1, partial [Gigaspora rosea]
DLLDSTECSADHSVSITSVSGVPTRTPAKIARFVVIFLGCLAFFEDLTDIV